MAAVLSERSGDPDGKVWTDLPFVKTKSQNHYAIFV